MKQCLAMTLLSIMLILLCACNSVGDWVHDELPNSALFRQQDAADFFIETANYYYYRKQDKAYFSPKTQLEFRVLCNRPDCAHKDENCNAHVESGFGYWNNHLYGAILFGGDPHIFQMNLDGSEHKRVADIQMPLNPAGTAGGGYDFYFHDGYAYYSVTNEGLNALFRTNLETGRTERVLEDLLRSGTRIGSGFHFVGAKFYFVLWEEDGSYVMYGGDTETWECHRICDWPSGIRAWMVEGDTLYYYAFDRKVFCEYKLSTGVEQTFTAPEYFSGAACYDEEYIYLIHWSDQSYSNRGVSIFDREYHLLENISSPAGVHYAYDTQDSLLFDRESTYQIVYYLPKSAIGTGEVELLPIEDPYSYR